MIQTEEFRSFSEKMRADWNSRSRRDAHYYVAFGRRGQSESDFMASAEEIVPALAEEFHRLPPANAGARRALEIGCGPGRLMARMANYFEDVDGVDVSDEMVLLARERLRNTGARVHATNGVDLTIFGDNCFDFVYSCIVFQHIPEKQIVLNYLRESLRVMKPGGILRCQVRGVAPPPSEMNTESETWTGCFFTIDEIVRFAREESFPLVTISGVDTQYLWTTFRKPLVRTARPLGPVLLHAVTSASGSGACIPTRGRTAAVSLWTTGMPDDISLADFQISFDQLDHLGCYASPVTDSGACQINAILPDGIPTGRHYVQLKSELIETEGRHEIVVVPPPPLRPTILSVTDGLTLSSRRIETRTVRLLVEDVKDPGECIFRVAGLLVRDLQYERVEPITATFSFSFRLHSDTPPGLHSLEGKIADSKLDPIVIEIVTSDE